MFITRLIIATTNVQKRNKVSKVMYISSPPSVEEGKKDLDFLGMRNQPPPYGAHGSYDRR